MREKNRDIGGVEAGGAGAGAGAVLSIFYVLIFGDNILYNLCCQK